MEDKGQILLYQTPDGVTKIEVKLQDETVWLSLDQMAELFQRNKSTISRHIKMCLKRENYSLTQPLHFLQQFKLRAKERSNVTLPTTTLI